MAVYDLEETRTLRYRPSVLLQYFCNESINSSGLVGCLEAIAQKVRLKQGPLMQISSLFLKQLSKQVVVHSLPPLVSEEVCKILIACTHRYRKVREVALGYARQILETFSALMCDRQLVFTLLEVLTLMRRSCELQYTDEVSRNDFHQAECSIPLFTNSTRTKWISHCISPTTIAYGTKLQLNSTV